MAKKEKGFNLKLYAIIVFFAVAITLTLIVTFTFKSKYTAFYPEEVAISYVDTIAQTADGYNAYKNSLVSKNCKYGDFIRENYIYPIIYKESGYKPGDSVKGLKGLNDESYKGQRTTNDDGTLQGSVIDHMYEYYAQVATNGWDDYDTFLKNYFNTLCEVRETLFNDKYITDEIMFTALESNIKKYGEYLTGTEDEFDKNTGNQTSFKTTGKYQSAYGEDYVLSTYIEEEIPIDIDTYKMELDLEKLATYGVSADDITEVKNYKTTVKTQKDRNVATANVIVVKIGNSWYVDNLSTDTSSLYSFGR